MIPCRTESIHVLVFMNSATKILGCVGHEELVPSPMLSQTAEPPEGSLIPELIQVERPTCHVGTLTSDLQEKHAIVACRAMTGLLLHSLEIDANDVGTLIQAQDLEEVRGAYWRNKELQSLSSMKYILHCISALKVISGVVSPLI